MKLHRMEYTQAFPLSLEKTWEFFSNPDNLSVITPSGMDFKVTSPVPSVIYPGLIITYTVKPLLWIPITWVTEITHVREPFYFVDEQRFGPYRFWHHQHIFKEIEGGCISTDIVHYGLPLSPLSAPMNSLVVKRQLNHIFEYRSKKVVELFGDIPVSTDQSLSPAFPPI